MSMAEPSWSVDADLGSGGLTVTFSDAASRDLRQLGWLTRRLVERTVKDELLAPSGELQVRKVGEEHGKQVYELPVGNFSVRYETTDHPEPDGTQAREQTVVRVMRREDGLSAGKAA